MRSFIRGFLEFLRRRNVWVKPSEVEHRVRADFDCVVPVLMKNGWPIPVTDEGKIVCLELMTDHYLY